MADTTATQTNTSNQTTTRASINAEYLTVQGMKARVGLPQEDIHIKRNNATGKLFAVLGGKTYKVQSDFFEAEGDITFMVVDGQFDNGCFIKSNGGAPTLATL